MITITESAAIKVKELISELESTETNFLRVSVKGGGCSGLMYDLSFDTEKGDLDTLIEDNEIKVLVDNKSLLYLFGTELHFSTGLNGKGFEFRNPNASRTCGCGESFSL